MLFCPYTSEGALCAWILCILAHCLLLDKDFLCSPCVDVWQLRRGSRWGPCQHVCCASHHSSTVFPFTPSANGPKLQETSHCCFPQSVTQAPCKLKNFLFLPFSFLLPSLLCSFSLYFCSTSVYSSVCFGIKLMGFFPCLGPNRLRIKAGWSWARHRVDSGSGGVFEYLTIPPFTCGSGREREGCVFCTYSNPVSVSSPQLWPEGEGSQVW